MIRYVAHRSWADLVIDVIVLGSNIATIERKIPHFMCVVFLLLLKKDEKQITDKFELPGVVPYPDEGNDATDHRRPSPRQLDIRLIGKNGNCILLAGELIRGLSDTGLADIGECERGDVV